MFGVAIFLSFLLMTVQVLLHLYASSTVSAAAFDAARAVAAEEGRSCSEARATLGTVLGDYADRTTWQCGVDGEDVVVIVGGPSPAPLLDGFFGAAFDLGGIEREARVRQEVFR